LTQEQISEINKVKIIQLIKKHYEITSLKISTNLGLSHTTVNAYIQMFIDEGLVERAGVAASSGGRKPKIVRLIPEARYSFGVSVEPGRVHIVLVNLVGKEIVKEYFSYGKEDSYDTVLNTLRLRIEKIIESISLDKTKILGVGMVFPGRVNDENLMLEYIPNLNIKNYSLKQFEQLLGFKIYAENEAYAAAYAEQLIGKGNENGNFVYVSIADGIGTGIIIEKYIYKGIHKKAGEFGHMKVSDEEVKCNCGRTGCWELFASKNALIRYFEEYKKQSGYSVEDVFNAYKQGDIEAEQAVERYTRYLFAGIENILLSVNPEYVIIGGDLGEYAQEVIDMGTEKLHLKEKLFGYENIKIYCSGLKENGAVIGAALLPLEEIFNYQKNVL
jgi:predicted NBD/HSP70 family sugar kinase